MLTLGGSCGITDAVTLNAYFVKNMETPSPANKVISTYIYLYGTSGDIVYEDSNGNIRILPSAGIGYHPISARRILASGVITNTGASASTTAVGMAYLAANNV